MTNSSKPVSQSPSGEEAMPKDASEVLQELEYYGITYVEDVEEHWEVAAEPEPQYFETFKEAMKFFVSLKPFETERQGSPTQPADEERLRLAAERAGTGWWGCDTAERMADEIENLRARLNSAQPAERQEQRRGSRREPIAPTDDAFERAWKEYDANGNAGGWERVAFISGFGKGWKAALRSVSTNAKGVPTEKKE